jgi:hypothetical protein
MIQVSILSPHFKRRYIEDVPQIIPEGWTRHRLVCPKVGVFEVAIIKPLGIEFAIQRSGNRHDADIESQIMVRLKELVICKTFELVW